MKQFNAVYPISGEDLSVLRVCLARWFKAC